MIGRDNSLTERALLALLASRRKTLRWVGDLHDWRLIEPKRRRALLRLDGGGLGGEWEGRDDGQIYSAGVGRLYSPYGAVREVRPMLRRGGVDPKVGIAIMVKLCKGGRLHEFADMSQLCTKLTSALYKSTGGTSRVRSPPPRLGAAAEESPSTPTASPTRPRPQHYSLPMMISHTLGLCIVYLQYTFMKSVMHNLSLSFELDMQDTDTSDAIDDRRKMWGAVGGSALAHISF